GEVDSVGGAGRRGCSRLTAGSRPDWTIRSLSAVGVAEALDCHPWVAARPPLRAPAPAELAAENCAVLAVLGEETGGDALLVERLDQLPLRLADGGDRNATRQAHTVNPLPA